MPSTVSTVGALTLPIPAGAENERIADPLCDGLADWLAFCLNDGLNAKLATFPGNKSAEAVPAGNRFPWDPNDPQAQSTKLVVPALFVWWGGRSRREPATSYYDWRIRDINVLYVIEELPKVTDLARRAGHLAAADAIFHRATERRRHPDYGFGASPAGMSLEQSLGNGTVFLEYVGGEVGRIGVDEREGTSRKESGRDYPALKAQFTAWERIEADTMLPSDILVEASVGIYGSDEVADELPHFMDRVLDGPDGSELAP